MAIEQVTVHDLEDIARLPARRGTAVISVTDPGYSAPLAPGFGPTLRLAFHDIEDDFPAEGPGAGLREEDVQPFGPEQARALVAFVDALATGRDSHHLAVHCHAGISRSSAIAFYVARRYGVPLEWLPRFQPNRRVLRLLGECVGLRLQPPG